MDRYSSALHSYRQRLLIRMPKHPTIAGYFWIAYFFAVGMLLFG